MPLDRSEVPQELLERIAKLKQKAEGCEKMGSMEEAQSFADGVQRLLRQHRLTMADIEAVDLTKAEPIASEMFFMKTYGLKRTRKRVGWTEDLADIVCKAHGVKLLVFSGANTLQLVGRETNRKLAIYALVTLIRTAESLAQKEYDEYYYRCKRTGERMEPGYKASFLAGFIHRIDERIKEAIRKEEADPKAIVLLKNDLTKAQEWTDQNVQTVSMPGLSVGGASEEGYDQGRKRADQVMLDQKAIENQSRSHRQIGG